jgi:sugar lactone lactonase YvrE
MSYPLWNGCFGGEKMKKYHHNLSSIFVIGLFLLLTSISVYGDDIYYSVNQPQSLIIKIDSNGNQSIFASLASDVNPLGLAFDKSGNLYVANVGGGGSIIKIEANGDQSVFATLYEPRGVVFDSSGNLYASCTDGTIAKIDSTGNVSPFVSGRPLPLGLAFDDRGNLYVADESGGPLMKYDQNGNSSIFARFGYNVFATGLAFDRNGNLYVNTSNYFDGWIIRIDSEGVQSTFTSGLSIPWGLAFDSSGILYATDALPESIVKINSIGQKTFYPSDGNPCAIVAQIPEPTTLLLLGLGGLVIRRSR